MQKLINETDDIDDILAMTYEAEKTNTSEEITGVLFQPLYNGDSVNAFYNRTHVIQSYDKVLHQWEIMNTGKLVWVGRKLVYMRGEKDRLEANPSVIELPDVRLNQSIKITTTIAAVALIELPIVNGKCKMLMGRTAFLKEKQFLV